MDNISGTGNNCIYSACGVPSTQEPCEDRKNTETTHQHLQMCSDWAGNISSSPGHLAFYHQRLCRSQAIQIRQARDSLPRCASDIDQFERKQKSEAGMLNVIPISELKQSRTSTSCFACFVLSTAATS